MIVCGYYVLFFVGSYRETIGEMLFGLLVFSANIVKMDYKGICEKPYKLGIE